MISGRVPNPISIYSRSTRFQSDLDDTYVNYFRIRGETNRQKFACNKQRHQSMICAPILLIHSLSFIINLSSIFASFFFFIRVRLGILEHSFNCTERAFYTKYKIRWAAPLCGCRVCPFVKYMDGFFSIYICIFIWLWFFLSLRFRILCFVLRYTQHTITHIGIG